MANRKAQRGLVAATVRAHRVLSHDRTGWGGDDRERVLVAVRVNTDDVIHLVCKHPD
jgi:hypothetical protein